MVRGVGNENFDVWSDLSSVNGLVTQRVYGDAVDSVLTRLGSGGGGVVVFG